MTGYQSKRAMAQDKLAQPAQEPVAWMYQCTADNSWPVLLRHRTNWAESGTGLWIETPLYTTPPQRPWVEPTGNEWFEWWRVSQVADATQAEIDFADFLIIAQAVMTKLKEHNNG